MEPTFSPEAATPRRSKVDTDHDRSGGKEARLPGTLEILRGLLDAAYHLSPKSKGGAHTEVFALDAERLARVLRQWLANVPGAETAGSDEAAARFAQQLSQRFIMKVGNIEHFVMRLGRDEEAVLPRAYVTEAFGPAGYNLHPSFDKTAQDATEATREIPYFGAGGPEVQFAPFLPDAIRAFLARTIDDLPAGNETGVFLVYDVEGRRDLSVYEILKEDPYFTQNVDDYSSLVSLQSTLRDHPLDRAVTERLQAFFTAPITVGLRDTLRWLKGSRHPSISWEDARGIISDCFARHGNENYLLPETNLYAPSARLSPEELEEAEDHNKRVVSAMEKRIGADLPLSISRKMGVLLLQQVASQLLRHHHDYPIYTVEQAKGLVGSAAVRLVYRFFTYLAFHLADFKVPTRRNVDIQIALYRRGLLEAVSSVLDGREMSTLMRVLKRVLLEYQARNGILLLDGTVASYRQIPTTFYSFQQIADWLPPGQRVLHKVSLEDLHRPEKRFLLRTYPEIAEKLVVFFVMVLRFYLDTDFIPDLRPEEAGVNLFLLGIWGAVTENVIVLVAEDEKKEVRVHIRFVDNKDHFKTYRREVDRAQPLGLAKHALRLVGSIIEPGMLRAVGEFVQVVYDNRKGFDRKTFDLADHIDRLMEVSTEVVRKSMDETQQGLKAMVEDSLDDTTMLVSGVVRKVLRKPAQEQPPRPPLVENKS